MMVEDSNAAEKSQLRADSRARRRALSPEVRSTLSARAAAALAQSEIFSRARTIALYAAFQDEADPGALEDAARRQGAAVAYPRVEGTELRFHVSARADLRPGMKYEILEPALAAPFVAVHTIDLFIVPGLAFSQRGERLGYGRGYYDRVIRFARSGAFPPTGLAVGFGFQCQVVEALPQSPYDERLDAIVTEDGLNLVGGPPAKPGGGPLRGIV